LAVTALIIVCSVSAASARSSGKRAPRPVTLHPKFRLLGRAPFLLSDGRYLFVARSMPSETTQRGVLVDEQTSRHVTISGTCEQRTIIGTTILTTPSGTPFFGRPWLLSGWCSTASGQYLIYLWSLASGAPRTIVFNDRFCTLLGADCNVTAVGRDWVRVSESCYHCALKHVFQNLHTGALRGDPRTSPTRLLDLDSPTLIRKVCSPLRAPPEGTLTFVGKYVLAASTSSPQPAFLERCGSRRRIPVGTGSPLATVRELLWFPPSGLSTMEGIYLSNLHRFKVRIPAFLADGFTGFVLTNRNLYAEQNNGNIWAAPRP
jgi:hypothetical protein